MVRTSCSSGDGVEIVEGVAGASKTFALAAAREACQVSGHRVIGCSLAARAAKKPHDDPGIAPSTIYRLLTALAQPTTPPDHTTMVVVDEAALLGPRRLSRQLTPADTPRATPIPTG